jgi:hypothetical protein
MYLKSIHVMSIDIGIHNFAYVVAKWVQTKNGIWKINNFIAMKKIDLTKFDGCLETKQCQLSPHHDKCITDYLVHFCNHPAHSYHLYHCDYLLVEAQPPTGFIAIQEFFRQHYRSIFQLVQPKSVHKYYNIGKRSYDERKEFTTSYTLQQLRTLFSIDDIPYQRKHDIGDAYCQMMFYMNKHNHHIIDNNTLHSFPLLFQKYDINTDTTNNNKTYKKSKYFP